MLGSLTCLAKVFSIRLKLDLSPSSININIKFIGSSGKSSATTQPTNQELCHVCCILDFPRIVMKFEEDCGFVLVQYYQVNDPLPKFYQLRLRSRHGKSWREPLCGPYYFTFLHQYPTRFLTPLQLHDFLSFCLLPLQLPCSNRYLVPPPISLNFPSIFAQKHTKRGLGHQF